MLPSMHLRPAKYSAPPTNRVGEPSQVDGLLSQSAARWHLEQKKSSPSASSSSTMASLIDSSGGIGGNGAAGSGSLNNNDQAIQFTAYGQPHSPANIFNGKLNGQQHNTLLGPQYRYNSSDLPTDSPSGGGHNKLFMPDRLKQPVSNKTNARNNNNSNSSMNFSKHDRMKLMELSIINLVELSTMAAEEGKQELALDKAREALESFNLLKVAVMAQQDTLTQASRIGPNYNKNKANNNDPNDSTDTLQLDHGSESKVPAGTTIQSRTKQQLTTGVSLYELSLMINSNLAAQLANNGHLEESIELYTQLCKLAASGGGPNSNQATMMVSSSSSCRAQHETRFLLYRFGLNIGNIYQGMQEYQRALKYYRLTLDRLSASSAYKSIKIKLMHNIALTFLAMGQLSDAATSLNLLLSDNLVQCAMSTNEQQATNLWEACNSNHHVFGLNLMVCHHQRADLSSMMATLKTLVNVDICRQYERVFDLAASGKSSLGPDRRDDTNDGRRGSSSSSSTLTGASVIAASGSGLHTEGGSGLPASGDKRSRQGGNTMSEDFDGELMDTIGARAIRVAMQAGRAASSFLGATQQHTVASATNKIVSGNGDATDLSSRDTVPMEMFQNETRRLLTTTSDETLPNGTMVMGSELDYKRPQATSQQVDESCGIKLTKLSTAERSRQLMRLIQDDRLERLIGDKHNQISRSLIMGCNLMLDLDNRIISQSNQSGGGGGGLVRTPVFEFCQKLMATSECYKALVYELESNCASGMLLKRNKLDEAIAVLRGMDQEQQVDKKQQQHHNKDNASKSTVKSSTTTTTNKHNNNNKNCYTMIHRSSMVATNCSLINLLQCNTKRASEYGNQALKVDKFNVQALINLANCHYLVKELDYAEDLYHQALLIDPNSWEANYNLALLSRKLGRHYNELKEPTKLMLARYRQCFSALIWHGMILSVIQSALIYHESGMLQQSHAIVSDLLSSSRQAPELILFASRLIDDPTPNIKESTKPSVMSILQQANRDHPYHLPIAERLIALNIQSFNYEQAKALLCTCIINRPDQAKWYQMLAECFRRAADYNKAIAIYKNAVDAFPQDTSCLKALIKLTDELGLTEEKKKYSIKLERAQN